MEDKLWRILENVNKWLDYAERKNTILLSFIGIQLTVWKTFIKVPNGWLIAAYVFLGICFLVTLISFFPQTFIPEWIYIVVKDKSLAQENDNLIFFGHISKYSLHEYAEKLEKYFDSEIISIQPLMDICSQIIVNAQIATKKYNMFKFSTWLMIGGEILFLISLWV